MKPLRIALIFFVAGLVVVGGGLVALDPLAQRAIESGGSHAFGVPTKLGEANVGVVAGNFKLHDLSVANPAGFRGEHLFQLQDGALDVSVGSLLGKEVVAQRLELSGLRLLIERGPEGEMNYEEPLRNLKRLAKKAQPKSEPKPEEAPTGKQRTYLLREIVLRDIQTVVDLLGGGDSTQVTLKVPEIRLTDLGSRPLSLTELCDVVLRATIESSLDVGEGVLPALALKQLEAQLKDIEGTALSLSDDAVRQVEEAVKGLTEGIENPAVKGAVDEALDKGKKELEKGLKDLFGN